MKIDISKEERKTLKNWIPVFCDFVKEYRDLVENKKENGFAEKVWQYDIDLWSLNSFLGKLK
jgi:hypothetical protein